VKSPAPSVIIYTDGACSGNPGPGGWAAVLLSRDQEKHLSGGSPATTSNRMELQAMLEGIKVLKRPCRVTIVTDSQNAIGWLSLGWKRKVAEIALLCREIDQVIETGQHKVTFRKVKGHGSDRLNEQADALARAAIPTA